jgi:hypothetical protein
MARKKKEKKAVEIVKNPEVEVAPEVAPEPVAEPEPAPAVVAEQVVLRRGAGCGGAKTMLKSDYDKELKKERGKK